MNSCLTPPTPSTNFYACPSRSSVPSIASPTWNTPRVSVGSPNALSNVPSTSVSRTFTMGASKGPGVGETSPRCCRRASSRTVTAQTSPVGTTVRPVVDSFLYPYLSHDSDSRWYTSRWRVGPGWGGPSTSNSRSSSKCVSRPSTRHHRFPSGRSCYKSSLTRFPHGSTRPSPRVSSDVGVRGGWGRGGWEGPKDTRNPYRRGTIRHISRPGSGSPLPGTESWTLVDQPMT